MVIPSDKTRAAGCLEEEYQMSERMACQVLSLNRSTQRRLEHRVPIDDVVEKVIELSEA